MVELRVVVQTAPLPNCAYNSGAGSKSVFLVVSLVATIGTPAAQKFGKGVSGVM